MNYIGKRWRDSASLIVLSRKGEVSRLRYREDVSDVNYDILLQTRTESASFPNSVVFPGGVSEQADAADCWRRHLTAFGFQSQDFERLHRAGTPLTPIFKDNPVQRHIALRITAIRETFEELGLLLCSRDHKKDRSGVWAGVLKDIDVKHWQARVSKNPGELLTLCQEYNCYPDIWSLYYWSNWLSPARLPKRFSTGFFVTAVQEKPLGLASSSEVTDIEWSSPIDILNKPDVVLYPPQVYELYRLAQIPDLDQLINFAKDRSCCGEELYYPYTVKAKDGILFLLPGDDLYPTSIDYYDKSPKVLDKTLEELKKNCKTLHRIEIPKQKTPNIIFRNYRPANHINMGDVTLTYKITIH